MPSLTLLPSFLRGFEEKGQRTRSLLNLHFPWEPVSPWGDDTSCQSRDGPVVTSPPASERAPWPLSSRLPSSEGCFSRGFSHLGSGSQDKGSGGGQAERLVNPKSLVRSSHTVTGVAWEPGQRASKPHRNTSRLVNPDVPCCLQGLWGCPEDSLGPLGTPGQPGFSFRAGVSTWKMHMLIPPRSTACKRLGEASPETEGTE